MNKSSWTALGFWMLWNVISDEGIICENVSLSFWKGNVARELLDETFMMRLVINLQIYKHAIISNLKKIERVSN